jgi:hypothetical protein
MKANFFKKLFYLPNYLSLPVAGIEICNNSVVWIEFSAHFQAIAICQKAIFRHRSN